MTWTKTKTAAVAGAVVLLAAGIGFVAVKMARSANAPDIQGNWAGIMEIKEIKAKSPVLYKISRANGSYHAVGVSPYRGAMEVPLDKVTYHFPSVHMERLAVGFIYDATLNPKTMEMSGTWKVGKIFGPLTLKLNALPDAFPEPLAESDYAPRKDSDVQGYWQGTLQAGNNTLRVALKIAERTNGAFRAVFNSLDQGGLDIEATVVSYHAPTVKAEFGGIGGAFEGKVESGDRVITGNWTQGSATLPLTLERANAQAAAAKEADIEAQKDYSHTGPNDLPGHWQGTLVVKQAGVKLRLALNIAKLPDGKFSCSMVSLDQGGAEIPASIIEFVPPNVRVEWNSIGASCGRGRPVSTRRLRPAALRATGSMPIRMRSSRAARRGLTGSWKRSIRNCLRAFALMSRPADGKS